MFPVRSPFCFLSATLGGKTTHRGSQSESGCQFVERILTVVESLRAQGRDILAFLADTMSAAAHRQPPPSLLPAPALTT